MIRIILGNVGSGKTARIVREIIQNKSHRHYFSNIKTKKTKNNHLIDSSMIIKTHTEVPEGCRKPVTTYSLNVDFWKKTIKKYGAISVVIDEAHTVMNSRKFNSKINIIMTDFLALIRRVLGQSSDGYGELILISQLSSRLDVIARSMATAVHYHVCHYQKTCLKCGYTWQEHNEVPETCWNCPKCNSTRIKKHNHIIEVWHFKDMQIYENWKLYGMKTYHRHYFIKDIEDYFSNYDTLQWDNMISEYSK